MNPVERLMRFLKLDLKSDNNLKVAALGTFIFWFLFLVCSLPCVWSGYAMGGGQVRSPWNWIIPSFYIGLPVLGAIFYLGGLHSEKKQIPGAVATHCRACGYDMRGVRATGRCPECGESTDPLDPADLGGG